MRGAGAYGSRRHGLRGSVADTLREAARDLRVESSSPLFRGSAQGRVIRSFPSSPGRSSSNTQGVRGSGATLNECPRLGLVTLIASSEDDWDTYESLHWRALETWLAEHPRDPDTIAIRERHEAQREAYLRHERALFGWAIFVGRVP